MISMQTAVPGGPSGGNGHATPIPAMSGADFDCFAGRSTPESGAVVQTQRAALWCHEGGDAQGEPILLVGGFTAGHFVFDFSRPHLADFRLITWEPRGLGRSECPDPAEAPYSVEMWARDLLSLAAALEIERFHVWAAGFGSDIAP